MSKGIITLDPDGLSSPKRNNHGLSEGKVVFPALNQFSFLSFFFVCAPRRGGSKNSDYISTNFIINPSRPRRSQLSGKINSKARKFRAIAFAVVDSMVILLFSVVDL